MGKKAKLKKIRRLAAQMPEIQVNRVVGERIPGYEVIKEHEVTEIDGKPVSPDAVYTKKRVEQKPLNHNRKMKQLYNRHGVAGVQMYVNAVASYVDHQRAKMETDPAEQIVEMAKEAE